jgi:hypothetical protein
MKCFFMAYVCNNLIHQSMGVQVMSVHKNLGELLHACPNVRDKLLILEVPVFH